MVSILSLWMPIVLSAVAVFIASSILHMVLTYHRRDYRQLPDEAAVLDALRRGELPPGVYNFPYCASGKEMGTPEMQEKYKRGPIGMLSVMPSGPPKMGKFLLRWFVFCLLVSVAVACLLGGALPAGTEYMVVFHGAALAAFMAYGFGEIVAWIWKAQPVSNTLRGLFDALIYALLTAGFFGWLWPAA
jgi:hypothetical protein